MSAQPTRAPRVEVLPRYEHIGGIEEVVAWDVWLDREEVSPGVCTGHFLKTFDNETDAIDYRAAAAKWCNAWLAGKAHLVDAP